MKKKIMLVEDDEGILDVMKVVLEMNGYEVICASCCAVAKKEQRKAPDLYILDLWVGRTDGSKICSCLKKDIKTRHIPVMLVSASRDLKTTAKKVGADDYLEKPFEIDDLLTKVKKLVRGRIPSAG